jgi:hypothetical protein
MTHAELLAALTVLPTTSRVEFEVADLLAAVRETALTPAAPEQPETWMTAKEVGAMLGTSSRWAFDHQKELGGRKLSRKCVRFSSRAVQRHLARRNA